MKVDTINPPAMIDNDRATESGKSFRYADNPTLRRVNGSSHSGAQVSAAMSGSWFSIYKIGCPKWLRHNVIHREEE